MKQYNFNFGWKFYKGDFDKKNFDVFASSHYKEPQWLKAGNNGAALTNLDDSDWQPIRLPHDFVIETSEFTSQEVPHVGSLKKDIAWYRKTFELPEDIRNQRIFIEFDGVFRDSQVWCNGHFMGRHLGGYMGFTYELTEVISKEGPNTIAVCVDARGYEGWWYEGGGIYRDVHLFATEKVRIEEHSVFAKPYHFDLVNKCCDLDVEFIIDSNQYETEDITYEVCIYNPNQVIVQQYTKTTTVPALGKTHIKDSCPLSNIVLWDLEHSNMYQAMVTISYKEQKESMIQKFAIRELKYAPTSGMTLNGIPTFMKGVCGHDDFAGVGVALSKSVIAYKIQKLKEMGCNAYRCSHNPPSPLFLDLCDEMGMLVLDETRVPGTSREVMDDYIALIKRDRNHPCVAFFSMGNEEMNIQHTNVGTQIFTKMRAIGKQYDDSRDYMYAINGDKNVNVDFIEGDGLHLPVHGVNYITNRYKPVMDLLNERHPTCCFISTESTGSASIRGYKMDKLSRPILTPEGIVCGVWAKKEDEGILSCYGDFTPVWSFTPELSIQEHADKPYLIGDFLWTGFDYRGEVFPYEFPQVVSSYGIIDLCGFFKDWAYHVQAWWGDKDVLHVFPSWNLPEEEGTPIRVIAFTNCDEVELKLNGQSLGRKTVEKLSHVEWSVPYQKGAIEAFGYRDGVQILYEKSVTAGEEFALQLSTHKSEILANHDDCTMVVVEVVDIDGNLVNDSVIDVDFSIQGVGTIKGLGNGNPQSHEHDKKPMRKLYAGKALVVIEGTFETGDIILSATANNVKPAEICITAKDTKHDNYIFSTEDILYGTYRERIVDL